MKVMLCYSSEITIKIKSNKKGEDTFKFRFRINLHAQAINMTKI